MPYESTTIEASDDTPLPATATTDLFEKAQATYRLIVASNYLCHTEITREMRRELAAFAACNDTIKTQGISVLDLGCGDCALVARLFDASRAAADGNFQLPQLRKFVGVDLAAAALQVAEITKPFPPSCSVELHQADFFQCFAEAGAVGDQTFDVIVSSFAIHHLPTERKGALFKLIKQRLNPGGLFLGADVVNVVVGRNREATMVAWRPHVLQGYACLSVEQRQTTWSHISQHDLPEDKPTMSKLFKEAGFAQHRCIFEDNFYVAVWAASVP